MRKVIIAATSSLLLAGTSQAAVVNFNGTATSSTGITGDGKSYSEAGLTFTSSAGGLLMHWGATSNNADASGATLMQGYDGEFIDITASDASTFSLNSIDLGDVFNVGSTVTVPFSYVINGATSTSSLQLDNLAGLQSFALNLRNISSFRLTQVRPWFQLDNVNATLRTDVSAQAAAVPEPATWAMMLFGFGSLGYLMRRRSTTATRIRFA